MGRQFVFVTMMLTRIAITLALATLAWSSASQLKQGDWGHLSFMINPGKCFNAAYSSRGKEKLYTLYTNLCHPDMSYQSQLMQWRYDAKTHQLQNRGLTANFKTPYCLAADRIYYKARIWVVPCKGNNHFKFLIRDDFNGAGIQFILEADPRYCIEWYGTYIHHSKHNTYGYLYHCRAYDSSSEQWNNFVRKEAYNGPVLSPIQDPKLSDGTWGHLRFPYTGMCVAVDAVHFKLVQRVCHETDESQKFRYEASRGEIRNAMYPRTGGGGGCATRRSSYEWYITSCTGSHHQKFLLRDATMFYGTYQQVQELADSRYCWEMYRSDTSGYIRSKGCHSQSATYMDPQYIQFSPWQGSVTCPAGKIPNSGGNACVKCAAGTYNPEAGGKYCYVCKAGATSQAGATSCYTINTCPAGTYMPANTAVCHQCPRNTFTNTVGNTECSPCPSGTHTKGTGSTHCVEDVVCPPGSFLNGAGCTLCPANTYSAKANAGSCVKCPKGTASQKGATSCYYINTCPAGTFMEPSSGVCHSCPVNTFTNTQGNTDCSPCPSGTHTKHKGSTHCVPDVTCPPGSFINGAAGCTPCPVNTYSNRANSDSCMTCPKGHYTQSTGSTSCLQKTFCGPGKFHNGHVCRACPRNTFDNTVGNTKCKPCPGGYETKATGATRCTKKNNCPAGSFYSEYANSCKKCPKNTFTSKPHQVRCVKCPAGTGTRAEGATRCQKINYCKPGKYHNGERCEDCPLNTFTDTAGAWKCQKCPWGQITDKKGAPSCRDTRQADCTPGNYFNGLVCKDCPKNHFSPTKGMRYCKKCAKGYETKTTGSKGCTIKEGKVVVKAESAAATLYCKRGLKSPACLVKCRFETNTGVKISDKTQVSFYKLVGTAWKSVGPVYYNNKTNWFSTKVAARPSPPDSGVYKCIGQYGGSSGSVQVDVVVS